MITKQRQFSSLFILTAASPVFTPPTLVNVLHCPPHSYTHIHTRTGAQQKHTQTHTLTHRAIWRPQQPGLPFLSASAPKVWSLRGFVQRWGTFFNAGGGVCTGGVPPISESQFELKVALRVDSLPFVRNMKYSKLFSPHKHVAPCTAIGWCPWHDLLHCYLIAKSKHENIVQLFLLIFFMHKEKIQCSSQKIMTVSPNC